MTKTKEITFLVTASLLIAGHSAKSLATESITVYETCIAGFYQPAQSQPTVRCTADWDPGGTLADTLRHTISIDSIQNDPELRVSLIPLLTNDAEETWFVLCSTVNDLAFMNGIAVPMLDGSAQIGPSADFVYGPIGAYPQC